MKNSSISPLLQGLDMMPDGICFYKDGDGPVYMNAKMKAVAEAAFMYGAKDCFIMENFEKKDLKGCCRKETVNGRTYLILPDGSAWSIKTKKIVTENENYTEYTARDETKLYETTVELKKRREHIEKANEKIREYNKKIDSVIRERELLDAKVRIHDDMGRALLSLRSYLYREDKDRGSLVKLWRVTVSILRRETVADVSDDRIDALSEAASAVDVTLHFDGEIPDDPVIREISAAAIRECLTNTVKHADGHNLYIKTSYCCGAYTIKIKNDGKQPDKPVEETGGLHTLRKTAERYGGKMKCGWERGFELTVSLGGE
ncbi:MAG: ATP-binding protein [Clostridia bacterium]|nr:ATP-binding protein [Clostridia bacterium]